MGGWGGIRRRVEPRENREDREVGENELSERTTKLQESTG